MNEHTKPLLSQSEVSRLANIPQPRFIRLVKSGSIVPDFTSGKTILFHPERADAIKKEFGKS